MVPFVSGLVGLWLIDFLVRRIGGSAAFRCIGLVSVGQQFSGSLISCFRESVAHGILDFLIQWDSESFIHCSSGSVGQWVSESSIHCVSGSSIHWFIGSVIHRFIASGGQ